MAAIWGCFLADLKLKGLGLPLKSPSLSRSVRYPEDGLKPQLCRLGRHFSHSELGFLSLASRCLLSSRLHPGLAGASPTQHAAPWLAFIQDTLR